jgi:iron donor protein CyaY
MSNPDFQDRASEAIADLEEKLLTAADEYDFEVESSGGILTIVFQEPSAAKFIVSPNSPARQMWVSALSTSFKFDWDDSADSFVLEKTREPLTVVMGSLVSKHLGQTVKL